MRKPDIITAMIVILVCAIGMVYYSVKFKRLEETHQEAIELKDAKIMSLQIRIADFSRIHKWIPFLGDFLTDWQIAELNAWAEKQYQEKARSCNFKNKKIKEK